MTTSRFGELEYDPDQEIHFPEGLPAFESETRFVPVEIPGTAPVVFLQSLNRPDLTFVTLPALSVAPDYSLAMIPEDLEILGLPPERQPGLGKEVLCLAIVTIGGQQPPSVNLMAPVVIHIGTRRAVQAIQPESPWSHQHQVPLD